MKSFHIITFGCQMNEHDSERMTGILEAQGFAPAPDAGSADLVIMNTCSIREKAEQKFFSELGRLRLLRDANPNLKIAVAGCIAQQEGAGLLSRAPFVDMIFGPSDIGLLSDLGERTLTRAVPLIDTSGDPDYHRKSIPAVRIDKLKAWVSIMYGCDNFCAYCVVPYLRGRERSRHHDDIVQEVRELALRGYKEVTLLGQNVNSYGKGTDRNAYPSPSLISLLKGEKHNYHPLQGEGQGGDGLIDFPSLLRLMNDVPGIERVRFVTSHPRDLSDRLITALRDLPKVCEALHLPVQSGSNAVLGSMNRRYTREDYLDKVGRLRLAVPDIALTTDIIVGFPGETEQDFDMTMELLAQVRFDGVFAFKYSKRPGTAALKLSGHVAEEVKEKRLDRVLALQQDIALKKNREYVGTTTEVLLDGYSKKGGMITGRTRGNKAVNVAASPSLIGSLAQVRIISSGVNSLIGQLCE